MKGGAEADREKADIHGKIIVTCQDLDEFDIEDLGVLKSITGGDEVKARQIYKPAFSFYHQTLLIGAANDPPRTGQSDPPLQRRIRFIVMETPIQFTNGVKNEFVHLKYTDHELDILFTQAINASAHIRRQNLPEPTQSETSQTFTERYWLDQDILTATIKETCHYDDYAKTSQAVIVRKIQDTIAKRKLDQPVPSQPKIRAALTRTLPKHKPTQPALEGSPPPHLKKGGGGFLFWHHITLEPPPL